MSGTDLSSQIIEEVISWVGTPYRHQASVKGAGCDCLGLVRGVWRSLYDEEPEPLPVYSPNWAERGQSELLRNAAERFLVPIDTPQTASVLLFRMDATSPVKHCGILINQREFVHAYWGRSVSRSAYGRWWKSRFAGAYNFPKIE